MEGARRRGEAQVGGCSQLPKLIKGVRTGCLRYRGVELLDECGCGIWSEPAGKSEFVQQKKPDEREEKFSDNVLSLNKAADESYGRVF